MVWLALLLCSLQRLAWAQTSGHEQGESFFASLPEPRRIVAAGAFVNPGLEEVRLQESLKKVNAQTPPAEMQEIQALAEQLDKAYGDNDQAKMGDPRWARMVALSQSSALEKDSQKKMKVTDQVYAFRAATHSWLKQRGLLETPAWKGRMVLLLDGPLSPQNPQQMIRYTALVDFVLDNRFYQSSLGRQVWSGSYQVTFQSDEVGPSRGFGWQVETRTVSRSGKAHAQMFLGREGWFLKFQPVNSKGFRAPLPTLSNLLLNLPLLDDPKWTLSETGGTSNGDIGTDLGARPDGPAYLQGYPRNESGPRQRGAVEYVRPAGGRVRVGFDFAPGT